MIEALEKLFPGYFTLMVRSIVICCLLLIGQQLSAQQDNGQLHDRIQQLAEKHRHAGFAVAVVNKDSILYEDAFGYADVKAKLPYTVSTLQPVGSVSKTLIGFALMKAVEQGLFTLETAVSDVLPFRVVNPHFPDDAIRIKNLATHTSSINDRMETLLRSYFLRPGADSSLALFRTMRSAGVSLTPIEPSLGTFLKEYFQKGGKWYHPENFEATRPGAAYHYSNFAAALAAYAVEYASGMSFSAYTRKYLLEPFGMDASGWFPNEVDSRKMALLYNSHGQLYPAYGALTYPDGSFITSSHDLARYLQHILRGAAGDTAALPPALFREMLRAQFHKDNLPQGIPESEPNSGIFWAIDPEGHPGHVGSDPGVVAYISLDLKSGTARLFIANTERRNHLEGILNEELIALREAVWKLLEE
ncbi:MAG TPA: serine hydrolase domain-containing protein [Anseongella sp.]|nr:serine hydrolase domain-containing protein [Anseongella sp.]